MKRHSDMLGIRNKVAVLILVSFMTSAIIATNHFLRGFSNYLLLTGIGLAILSRSSMRM
jgi:hypothetical protein